MQRPCQHFLDDFMVQHAGGLVKQHGFRLEAQRAKTPALLLRETRSAGQASYTGVTKLD